jgi:hypothetical protein
MITLSCRRSPGIFVFLLAGTFIAAGAYSQQGAGSLKLVEPPPVTIDPANSGSTLLHLINVSATAVPVVLSAGPLISKQTGRALEATVSFSLPDGTRSGAVFAPQDTLVKDQPLIVKVNFSNAWEAGESEATLFNDSTRIGTVKTIKYRFPFNVHLDTTTPVPVRRGKASVLVLKNEDEMTYPIHWRLGLAGSRARAGSMTLAPKSSTTIEFKPPADWFESRFGGLFKDDLRNGLLTLQYAPRGTVANPFSPVQEIPLQASLSYWREPVKAFWSTLFLLLVLTLGVVTSFFLNYWIPNKLRLLTLKEWLGRVAAKTRNLSTRIDSTLRVVLRVERRRLEESLNKRMTLSPDFGDTASQAERALQVLEQRVDLLEDIDSTYWKLSSAAASGLSPSFCDSIYRKLGEAEDRLEKSNPQDPDTQATRTLLTDAAALLKVTSIDDRTLQDLRDRFLKLWPDFQDTGAVAGTASFGRLKPRFEKLLARCQDIAGNPAQKVTAENYLWLDTTCVKLALAREYVELAEARPGESTTENQEREKRLVEYLSQDNGEALGEARLLVKQMREGIFREDIENEIATKNFSIEIEPLTVYAYEPVLFQVRFRRPSLNQAAALQRVSCIWCFGHDGFMERGWSTCHFFPETLRRATVKASFEDSLGRPILDKDGQPVSLEREIPQILFRKLPVGERLKVELIRTGAVLIAAMLGLLAGARTELLKADLSTGVVAVFLLGFSADALKNLLAKK